jgi:predicted acetyltransferase
MTPEITVRPCTAVELSAYLEVLSSAFGGEMDAESRAQWEPFLEWDQGRMLAAVDTSGPREQLVGTTGWLNFDMTVPGAELPAAAVTMVTVRPTHTRRGILRQMMRRQLDDARAQGFAIATLWASEAIIYQRFGYGLGFVRNRIEIERHRTIFLNDPGPVGQARLLSRDEALELLPPVYEQVRQTLPASFRRSRLWWEKRTLDTSPRARHGGGPIFTMALTIDGQISGYAIYNIHASWGTDGLSAGWLDVLEALGTTPAATREVWRYLFGVDLISRVKTFRLCAEHPLLLSLADARQLRTAVGDGTWVRLLEIGPALEGRRYLTSDSLTFQLIDAFCPWNDGVWTLEASAEGASLKRSTAAPELRLSAAELSAMYLGTVKATSLLHAGRLDELSAGAATRADSLFGWDTPPWCLDDF